MDCARTALSETDKSAWFREHGLYPGELDQWRASCTSALAEPEEARTLQRWKTRCVRTLEREMTGDG